MKYLSKRGEETNKIAEDFLKTLGSYTHTNIPHALIVGLFGDLGSGKTTFTQALGRLLGVQATMTSPTFVIMKKYEVGQDQAFSNFDKTWPCPTTLIHIDAYRLESGKELSSLGFAEIVKDPQNLILIEWPERVADILPPDLVKINFKFVSEFGREIEF